MNRTSGIMNDAESPIQHFNVACRAARNFPSLAIARLLISLNDFDVPLFSCDEKSFEQKQNNDDLKISEWIYHVLNACFNFFLNVFTALPVALQDVLIECVVVISVNLFLLLFYVFGLASLPGAVVVAALLLVAFWLRENHFYAASNFVKSLKLDVLMSTSSNNNKKTKITRISTFEENIESNNSSKRYDNNENNKFVLFSRTKQKYVENKDSIQDALYENNKKKIAIVVSNKKKENLNSNLNSNNLRSKQIKVLNNESFLTRNSTSPSKLNEHKINILSKEEKQLSSTNNTNKSPERKLHNKQIQNNHDNDNTQFQTPDKNKSKKNRGVESPNHTSKKKNVSTVEHNKYNSEFSNEQHQDVKKTKHRRRNNNEENEVLDIAEYNNTTSTTKKKKNGKHRYETTTINLTDSNNNSNINNTDQKKIRERSEGRQKNKHRQRNNKLEENNEIENNSKYHNNNNTNNKFNSNNKKSDEDLVSSSPLLKVEIKNKNKTASLLEGETAVVKPQFPSWH